MKYLIMVGAFFLSLYGNASPVGDCSGTPEQAVMVLPSPLSEWGKIACTPYGHIITNKEGWTWSNPGSYSPIMIPSQMVRSNPEPLGSKSFFTEINMVAVTGQQALDAIKLFEAGFDSSETAPTVYSLTVSSVSGKELGFQFFDYGDSQWGMWCNKECNPNSKFMLLNMAKRPNKTSNPTP